MKVKKIVIHEDWDKRTLLNDIALLQFEEDAEITDTVGTVCLATSNLDPKSKPMCLITGEGN